MIRHYFKLALKALIKHKYYTFINVFGLVCGMLSVLIIGKYIGASLQFDSFHVKRDQIYSLSQEQVVDGNAQEKTKGTYLGVADLITPFPELMDFTKYYQHVESLVIAERRNGAPVSFTENAIFVADSSFLRIFTFPLIHGNPGTALSKPNSIVLTRSAARKYFGDGNPIGATLNLRVSWGKETAYQVTGVTDDTPDFSRFRFDFLITQPDGNNTDEAWYVPDYSIFLLLKENAEPAALADKLTSALEDVPQLKATNRRVFMSLESMSRVELSTEEYLLAIVAVFITLICWVNYINQTIAQSYWRIKQVGILRVMGATAKNVQVQFVVESGLVCITSLGLIVGIYLILEPSLQTFTHGHLLPLIGDPTKINIIFIGVFIIGLVLATTVQKVIHFSQHFRTSLQKVYDSGLGSVGLRKWLVVLQFSVSTILIVSVFVIVEQLEYLNTKDKGVTLDNVLIIKAPMARDTTWNAKRKTLELFKQRTTELPFVIDATSSTTIPGEEYRQETYLSLQGSANKVLVHQNGVDDHFFGLYEIEFIAGHDFIADARSRNRSSIILNESAAKALGISDYNGAINEKLMDHDEPDMVYDIIGIVNDYHQTSLKHEIRPMAFKFNVFRGHCSLKINSAGLPQNSLAEGLDAIKAIWWESYPDASFDHFFLTEKFAAQDNQDRYFGELFRYFTLLSMIISCLGLFGLSLLISTKRQKEVGIRKTFGASSSTILIMFLKGYTGPLLISLCIGCSLGYYMMSEWLENFAYRIEIGIGVVALAVSTLATIFFVTVSYSTVKSAMTNPIEVLRE